MTCIAGGDSVGAGAVLQVQGGRLGSGPLEGDGVLVWVLGILLGYGRRAESGVCVCLCVCVCVCVCMCVCALMCKDFHY